MTRSAFAPIGPEFEPFLFAAIGEDPNGKILSVLSAFARTDIDPWKEAASLARMSAESATTRLAAFIAALPNEPNSQIPARRVAGELIKLLPKPSLLGAPIEANISQVIASDNARFGLSLGAAAFLIGMAFLFWYGQKPVPVGAPVATQSAPAELTPRELGK